MLSSDLVWVNSILLFVCTIFSKINWFAEADDDDEIMQDCEINTTEITLHKHVKQVIKQAHTAVENYVETLTFGNDPYF